jgi:putative DNA methylase
VTEVPSVHVAPETLAVLDEQRDEGPRMIHKQCKRLAEVDFPIAEVSRHAAREKSIRHGHPSTLHLWWARRPLASSRAVLLGLLWPDPCDPLCPEEFKQRARALLPQVQGQVGPTDEDLRKKLLKFIGDFANWDLAAHRSYLEVSRALVKAAHGEEPPLVVDPFAGGGSIPLEALRLGCEAFASDLNPVACLILKVMLEDIPRHGPELAEELRRVGAEIKKQAEQELADLYLKDPDGATPIAYLWARTVRCEAPNCGVEIPIYKSAWLSKKSAKKARYFKEAPDGRCRVLLLVSNPLGGPVEFRIARGEGSENPRPGFAELRGTKAKGNNANVICPCCDTVLPGNKKNPRTVTQLAAQRGGADVLFGAKGQRTGGARMLAVVTLRPGQPGRHYRLPTERDYEAVRNAQARLAAILGEWERGGRQGLCPVPDEPLPPVGTLGFRVQRYGMLQWGDLFTARQKVALVTFVSRVDSCNDVSRECKDLLAIAIGRVADASASLASWLASGEEIKHVFARQALPIVWDFGETNPTSDVSRSWSSALDSIESVLKASVSAHLSAGQVQQADACQSSLPAEATGMYVTDPPYYNAIPYSDLSDFFLVWLKRSLVDQPWLRDPFDPTNPLSPKMREAVQDETKKVNGRPKDRIFFEETMSHAFAEGRRILKEDGVGSVVFAHKTTEGWEALLSGMIRGGWTITGSWPIATEAGNRLRARESAALATSVHLICRPRVAPASSRQDAGATDSNVGDWANVLRELPKRVGNWMERLQGEGVRGADLVFACIGPALEIFSRFARVETADGRAVPLAEYLEKVWEVVGRSALAQVLGTAEARARNGVAGAVEEDARLTALFLWTLQSTDDAATFAEAARLHNEGKSGGAWQRAVSSTAVRSEDDEESLDVDNDDDDNDEGSSRSRPKGFTLVFDVVRRFAQPLGIELPKWERRVIETKKGVVRLLPIAERAKQLFGEDGAQAMAARLEWEATTGQVIQLELFLSIERGAAPAIRGRARGRGKRVGIDVSEESLAASREATTLDRVHAAMLLQAGGRTNALRALLKAERERGPEFLRLANALSALYPKGSEEKRLLDAMLLATLR